MAWIIGLSVGSLLFPVVRVIMLVIIELICIGLINLCSSGWIYVLFAGIVVMAT